MPRAPRPRSCRAAIALAKAALRRSGTPGPRVQQGATTLVLGDRVDHEAASPGVPAGGEEPGQAGQEAVDVAGCGPWPFHRGEPGADEAAEVPLQGPVEATCHSLTLRADRSGIG